MINKALDGEIEDLRFDKLPRHDSTWGLCTGIDGNIYIAACGEMTGGLSVFILRYIPETKKIEYLIEIGPELGEPPDNGHATQSKIHYCLIPGSDGLLYCATHASGPPLGDPIWRPWNSWDDTKRYFPGSYIFTYNPLTNKIENFGIGPKKEGSRALAFDEKRMKLYGITWPRNHFYVFYINSRTYIDLGRIGEINPQAIFLDKYGNAYTTDDYGYILKCNADNNEIKQLGVKCPHESYRQGWHNVLYDVVPAPDWSCFYGTDWGYESHLWRYNPYIGQEGIMEDLGRAFGPADFKTDMSLEAYQVRGLVFGMDGNLYFAMKLGWEEPQNRWIIRLNPKTLIREKVCPLVFGEHKSGHIASATQDFYGNLYFADAGQSPTGMYIYRPSIASMNKKVFSFKDIKQWG
jgi:hypothetical protein